MRLLGLVRKFEIQVGNANTCHMPHTLLRFFDRAFMAVALAEAVRRYVANPASRNGVVPAKGGAGAISSQEKVALESVQGPGSSAVGRNLVASAGLC